MTLQNLSRILDRYEQQSCISGIQQFELLKGLPFYKWGADSIQNYAHAVSLSHNICEAIFDENHAHKSSFNKNKYTVTKLHLVKIMLKKAASSQWSYGYHTKLSEPCQVIISCSWLFTWSLASCVNSLMIGVPTSTALSNPVITPAEKVFHPKPIMAKMTAINKIKPK